MKIIFASVTIISLCLSSLMGLTQTLSFSNFNPGENECYIIARGTKSKREFISKKFNSINDSITHIGIGITYNNEFRIFNINAIRNSNALTIESFESFINQEDLIYYGIWKLELCDSMAGLLKEYLSNIATKNIKFDFDFIVNKEDNNYYCSEFCWLATNELGFDYQISLRKINTSSLGLNKILKRDVLEYVPPDYFLAFPSIKYITGWRKENL